MSGARAGFTKVHTPLKRFRPKCKQARVELQFQMAAGTARCWNSFPGKSWQVCPTCPLGWPMQRTWDVNRSQKVHNTLYPEKRPFKSPLSDLCPGALGLRFSFWFERRAHTEFPGSWLRRKAYAECYCCYKLQALSYCVQLLTVDKKYFLSQVPCFQLISVENTYNDHPHEKSAQSLSTNCKCIGKSKHPVPPHLQYALIKRTWTTGKHFSSGGGGVRMKTLPLPLSFKLKMEQIQQVLLTNTDKCSALVQRDSNVTDTVFHAITLYRLIRHSNQVVKHIHTHKEKKKKKKEFLTKEMTRWFLFQFYVNRGNGRRKG